MSHFHLQTSLLSAIVTAWIGVMALYIGIYCLRQHFRVVRLGPLRLPADVVVIVCFISGPLFVLFTFMLIFLYSSAW